MSLCEKSHPEESCAVKNDSSLLHESGKVSKNNVRIFWHTLPRPGKFAGSTFGSKQNGSENITEGSSATFTNVIQNTQ